MRDIKRCSRVAHLRKGRFSKIQVGIHRLYNCTLASKTYVKGQVVCHKGLARFRETPIPRIIILRRIGKFAEELQGILCRLYRIPVSGRECRDKPSAFIICGYLSSVLENERR